MELKLPLEVVTQVDVARMLREVKGLDDYFVQAKARQSIEAPRLPKMSQLLEVVSVDNNYHMENEPDRQKLAAQLDQIIGRAPLMHISFATEPPAQFLESILYWLRSNIHPLVLLQVGLQPTIAAGCELRTANKVFDMSLRESLKRQVPFLAQLINNASKNPSAIPTFASQPGNSGTPKKFPTVSKRPAS